MHMILEMWALFGNETKYYIFLSKAVKSQVPQIPAVLFALRYKHLENQVLFT